jgi:type IV secretory pathway TraG/TraD family ATPase VirD4
MCFALLSLDNLIARLQGANLNLWVRTAFTQFMSVANSPETAASIVGTALGLFTRFIIPEVLGAMCGKTNLPLNLKDRQIIIFGTEDEKRDVLLPVVASALHLITARNLSKQRTTPLITSIDELPTIYLPALAGWLNQKREYGFCGILGAQNPAQLEETYGAEIAQTILAACATKAFFNAGSSEAAEKYSKYLGEEEITNRRRSRTVGGKSGASTNISTEVSKRPLFEPNQYNTLPTGKAVLISPGFKSGQEVSLPLLEQIKLSQKVERELEAESVATWSEYQQKLVQEFPVPEILEEDLRLRIEEAERLLPLKSSRF